jgi:hypothetical protein
VKNIDQLCAERLASVPIGKGGKPEARVASRARAEARGRFWYELAYALNTRELGITGGSAVESLFRLDNLATSLQGRAASLPAMRRFLDVDDLSFEEHFHLFPILGGLLERALTENGVDKVVCFVVAYARLALGRLLNADYGKSVPDAADVPALHSSVDDDSWIEFEFSGISSSEARWIIGIIERKKTFTDPARFEEAFPGMADRHADMMSALKPILGLDVFDEGGVILAALECAERLLKCRFADKRPRGKVSDAA